MPSSSEFSDGEVFAFFLSLIFGLVPFFRWYKALLFHGRFGRNVNHRNLLIVIPPLGLLFLEFVLSKYADPSVRAGGNYQWLFLLASLIWLNATGLVSAVFGISLTSDIIERDNLAATIAIAGAFAATFIVYAGGNIGSGATISTTLVSAFLGVLAMFFFWALLEFVTHLSHSIVEDRDSATGVRLSGFLIANALIFGYAMSGNWISMEATIADLWRRGWLSIPLLGLAIIFERLWKPSPRRPHLSVPTHGLAPFLAQVVFAIIALCWLRG